MTQQKGQKDELSHAVEKIKTDALSAVCAVTGGIVLFVLTIWLVIKGGPHTGAHLQLLSQYFIGYSVTWWGSFVGLFYGALTGGIIGWMVGTIYNTVVHLRFDGKE